MIGVEQGLFYLSEVCIYILKNLRNSYANEQKMGENISFSVKFSNVIGKQKLN